jgi:Rieske Fe-S protein
MKRREFLHSSCNFCLLGAAGFFLSGIQGCSPAYHVVRAEVTKGAILFPLSSLASSEAVFLRPRGWLYDIVLRKTPLGTFEALLLQCTHQQNQLMPTGNGYYCSLHGSQFDRAGAVKKGPAENSLKKYPVTLEGDQLIIRLKSNP